MDAHGRGNARLFALGAWALASAAGFAAAPALAEAPTRPIVVASKNFTESYILGEAIAQLLTRAGFPVEHKLGLGGTKICYDALAAGEVDAYVEYTGTIAGFKAIDDPTLARLTVALAVDGVEMLPTFGFSNSYAVAVATPVAAAEGIARISDLAARPELRLAFSHEFLERPDGWLGLKPRYGLPHTPTGIEHALAYQAIVDGAIDATDAYSTDGELVRHPLTVLEDDLAFFPAYLAVPLVRADLPPAARAVIATMASTLNASEMRTLNAAAIGGEPIASVAARYLAENVGAGPVLAPEARGTDDAMLQRLAANTVRHLQLVAWAVAPATLVAVLVAVAIFRLAWLSRAAVYVAGLLQTIPSIALLALLIPLTGIGVVPAVVALFLYALLPVLRNAVTALTGIDPTLRQVALAMGMTPAQQLRHVFVPLAMPSILAGVRTAAVISIGTATLAAFIGAGGLGDPIVTGLALNNAGLILEGAIPAALLAVVAELAFELVERVCAPGHLRARAA